MRIARRRTVSIWVVAATATLVAGCASTEQFEQVSEGMGALRQDVQAAQLAAEQASADAARAAGAAEQAAAEARRAAEAATTAARQAEAAAEKADRVFRESLRK